jgi:hypothetical protein
MSFSINKGRCQGQQEVNSHLNFIDKFRTLFCDRSDSASTMLKEAVNFFFCYCTKITKRDDDGGLRWMDQVFSRLDLLTA